MWKGRKGRISLLCLEPATCHLCYLSPFWPIIFTHSPRGAKPSPTEGTSLEPGKGTTFSQMPGTKGLNPHSPHQVQQRTALENIDISIQDTVRYLSLYQSLYLYKSIHLSGGTRHLPWEPILKTYFVGPPRKKDVGLKSRSIQA
jgi:hypothetical protein